MLTNKTKLVKTDILYLIILTLVPFTKMAFSVTLICFYVTEAWKSSNLEPRIF